MVFINLVCEDIFRGRGIRIRFLEICNFRRDFIREEGGVGKWEGGRRGREED